MNILINGSSLSRGKSSWPYFLMDKLDPSHNLVNLACAGSGNTYLHESTVSEVSLRSYDLVIIQWAYMNRLDFRVKDIDSFDDSEYTSKAQIKWNDWPEKKIWPINDTEYIQDNWVFGCGYINTPEVPSLNRLFGDYYKHTTDDEHVFSGLIKMISLQNTLKALDIPYLFTTYRPIKQFPRFENLYKLLDLSKFYDGEHLYTTAMNNDKALDETDHPLEFVHKIYADNLYDHLTAKGLINLGN